MTPERADDLAAAVDGGMADALADLGPPLRAITETSSLLEEPSPPRTSAAA